MDASSIINATLKISQVVYELKAVGESTRDLLNSTKHIQNTMRTVRVLRRQKSLHLERTEKEWIDDVLINTEKTLGNVAQLIEPARVEMQTKHGSIGLLNRGIFVFRDSPKVATNLSRLGLASQSLNTAMNILCSREGLVPVCPTEVKSPIIHLGAGENACVAMKPPPAYEESEFLNRRRSEVRKSVLVAEDSVTRANTIENEPCKPSHTPAFDEGIIPVTPVVAIQEVNPTPIETLERNPFEEPDGLQVCDQWGVIDSPSLRSTWSTQSAQTLVSSQAQQNWQDQQRWRYMCWREELESKGQWLPGTEQQNGQWLTNPPAPSALCQARCPSVSWSMCDSDTQSALLTPALPSRTAPVVSDPSATPNSQTSFVSTSTISEGQEEVPRPKGRSSRRAWLERHS